MVSSQVISETLVLNHSFSSLPAFRVHQVQVCVCVAAWHTNVPVEGARLHRREAQSPESDDRCGCTGRPLLQGGLHHTHNAHDCQAGANSCVGCVLVGVVMWGLASVDVRCVVGPNPNTNSDDVIIHRFDHSQPFRDSGTAPGTLVRIVRLFGTRSFDFGAACCRIPEQCMD